MNGPAPRPDPDRGPSFAEGVMRLLPLAVAALGVAFAVVPPLT